MSTEEKPDDGVRRVHKLVEAVLSLQVFELIELKEELRKLGLL